MTEYSARSGDAGVLRYRSNADSIKIEFQDGSTYLYTYRSASRIKIETMKKLAKEGQGLTTYINQHVRGSYASKLN